MALLFCDGFDDGAFAVKYDGYAGVSTTASTRFGTGLALNLSAAGSKYISKKFLAASSLFVGMAFYPNGQVNRDFMRIYGDNGATLHLYIRAVGATAPEIMQLYHGNGTLLASFTGIKYGVWYYLEIGIVIADAGGSCIIKLDGNTIINYSGDTKNGGTNTSVDTLNIGTVDWCGFNPNIDDLYICNSTGTTNNTFLGDIRVQTLLPNGAGSSTQFTPTGAANNYAAVSDVPDSIATYNASSTVGQRDTFTMADIGTQYTVLGAQNNIHAWKSDSGTGNVKIVTRSGGTDYYGSSQALSTSMMYYGEVRETNPATSTQWAPTDINSTEIGYEVA